jgi:hypothetical protein
MNIQRVDLTDLEVKELPDGSRVILSSKDGTAYALNPTAGAAWEACGSPTTLDRVVENMRSSFDPGVSEQLAKEAILQLEEKKLVTVSEGLPLATRREVLAGLSAVALPLVVSLTVGEQRAHAEFARSGDHRFDGRPRPKPLKHKNLYH